MYFIQRNLSFNSITKKIQPEFQCSSLLNIFLSVLCTVLWHLTKSQNLLFFVTQLVFCSPFVIIILIISHHCSWKILLWSSSLVSDLRTNQLLPPRYNCTHLFLIINYLVSSMSFEIFKHNPHSNNCIWKQRVRQAQSRYKGEVM